MLTLDIDMDVPRIGSQLKASVSATRKGGCGVYTRHAEGFQVAYRRVYKRTLFGVYHTL